MMVTISFKLMRWTNQFLIVVNGFHNIINFISVYYSDNYLLLCSDKIHF